MFTGSFKVWIISCLTSFSTILSLSLPISLCTISFQGLLTIILDTLWQKLKIYLVCFLWFTPRVSLFFRYFESTVKNYIYSNSTFLTQHKSKCKLDVIFASLFCLIYIFGVLYILDKILHENLADNLVIGI